MECDPSNFLSKIIERHFHDSLYDFLNENNLIYSRPLGFRRKHSTETQLETAFIKIIGGLLFNLDKDRVSGMVLVDHRKAFDMVDHELLLRKLKAYGVANQELNWCRSCLCSRKQVVDHVRGNESGEVMLKHGVPQGSIIGPLFFILFINDLPLHISADVDLYADDTTVTAAADVKNMAHLDLSLNKSVKEIQAWASANKLPINEDKTKVLTITRKRLNSKLNCKVSVRGDSDNTLCNAESAASLGLEVDSKLPFNAHVDKICKKLASRNAVLRKISAFLPLSRRVKYYNAVIRPVIRGTQQRQFSENICSEDDLRSRIFGTFVVKFLACLPLLGFSNI